MARRPWSTLPLPPRSTSLLRLAPTSAMAGSGGDDRSRSALTTDRGKQETTGGGGDSRMRGVSGLTLEPGASLAPWRRPNRAFPGSQENGTNWACVSLEAD